MDRKYRYVAPIACTDSFDLGDYSHMFDGEIETCIGPVKRMKTRLCSNDRIGAVLVRLGINRKSYKFPPGLYAIGNPSESAPVIVTSNYKLTVDIVRSNLSSANAWLLIVNTGGINVWCAAGKGSFGSDEIIYRIKNTGIYKISKSKLLILPQLGAPGVNPSKISKYTGFKSVYGPVRASDIETFLTNGLQASADMRRVTFSLAERVILSPVEIMIYSKYLLAFVLMFALLDFIDYSSIGFFAYSKHVIINTLPYVGAMLVACIAFPALLPLLPFRSFSAKGSVLGAIYSASALHFHQAFMYSGSTLCIAGHFLAMTSLAGFISLNFTGSTNFTSLSGVQKETLWSVPIFAVCFAAGIIFIFAEKLI